jgi:hypothetical protein
VLPLRDEPMIQAIRSSCRCRYSEPLMRGGYPATVPD